MSSAQFPTLRPGQAFLQPGSEIENTREGLGRQIMKLIGLGSSFTAGSSLQLINYATLVSVSPKSPSPLAPSLGLYSSKIKYGKGGLAEMSLEFRGLSPGLSNPPPPVYETRRTTSNEPLQTHPKWESAIAGTPAAPINGARFVSNGVNSKGDPSLSYSPGVANSGIFVGYPPADTGFNANIATFDQFIARTSDGKRNPWVGREDYRAVNLIFQKTYTSFSPPNDAANVGYFSAPDGPAPAAPPNFDWFFLGETSTDEASIYRNQASWQLVPVDDAARIIYSA